MITLNCIVALNGWLPIHSQLQKGDNVDYTNVTSLLYVHQLKSFVWWEPIHTGGGGRQSGLKQHYGHIDIISNRNWKQLMEVREGLGAEPPVKAICMGRPRRIRLRLR